MWSDLIVPIAMEFIATQEDLRPLGLTDFGARRAGAGAGSRTDFQPLVSAGGSDQADDGLQTGQRIVQRGVAAARERF